MPRARAVALLELELNQDERALHREWRFERIGWGVIALVLAAGFVGLFGDGALASTSVVSADGGAVLHYERIIRRGAPSDIELRLAAAAGDDTVVVISLDDEYLTAVDVDRVTPEPLGVRASSARVEYHLRRLDPAQPMTVVLSVQPSATGTRRAALGTSHGSLEFEQLVLP